MSPEPRHPADGDLLGRLAGAAAAIALLAYLIVEVYDLDVGFHLAIGADILARHRIPSVEHYAAAALGRPYHDSHWLFQAALAACHALLGMPGAQLACAGVWALALAMVYGSCRRHVEPAAAAILVFIAGIASAERFLPRPEIVTVLMIAWFWRRLAAGRWRTPRELALLGAAQAVWTNCHALFPIGPFLAGCYAVERSARRLRGEAADVGGPARLIVVLLGSTLLSPWGAGAWRYAWLVLTEAGPSAPEVLRSVGELSPTFGAAARSAPSFWFFLALVVAAAATGLPAVRRGVAPARALAAAGLFAASLGGRRNMVLFALAAAPLVAESSARLGPLSRRIPRPAVAAAIGALLLAAWFPLSGTYYLFMEIPARFGVGMTPSFFPHGLPEFLDRAGFRGQIFNSETLGGFYLLRGFPERLPLTDGRWEVYDPAALARIRSAALEEAAWRDTVEKYGVRGVLLQHASREARGVLPRISRDPAWRLVYWDAAASFWMRSDDPTSPPPAPGDLPPAPRVDDCFMLDLFLKDIGASALRVANLERALPAGWRTAVLLERLGLALLDSGQRDEAEATFRRLMEEDPGNKTALNELAFAAFRRGDLDGAETILSRALSEHPDDPDLRTNLERVRAARRERRSPADSE